MSEEIWDGLKAMKEEQRNRNHQAKIDSTQYLRGLGIPFESRNYGHHLMLMGLNGKVDFWPSTGRWYDRVAKKTGWGVNTLVELISGGTE